MSVPSHGVGATPRRWCPVCGTAHADPRLCPGELRATGPERPGWRVHVETPLGHEAIGVLVAPCHDVWRARILTFPNVLWTLPGGRATLKFVGATRDEAERSAIAFIEEHVQTRGLLRRDALEPVPAPAKDRGTAPTALWATAPRRALCLPVRYGVSRAATRGLTVNLSAEGMFVGAREPEDGGRVLFINLDVRGHTVPLRGLVMWRRLRSDAGRPTGMGIRLADPPPFYRSVVEAIP